MPLGEGDVDAKTPFEPDERLFRRVKSDELIDGEVLPVSLNSMSFKKDEKGAPSVLREHFATAIDALHPDCGGNADYRVYSLRVRDVPVCVADDQNAVYDFFPCHEPEVKCGAHSVISCCASGDEAKAYVVPSKKARAKFRAMLAVLFSREL